MLVWTSNLGKPQTLEVGVILDPNFFEVCFFRGGRRSRGRSWGPPAAQYSPFSGALRDPTAPGRRAPSRFAPFFSPQTPEGLGLVLSVIPSAFDLVHTARVVEGDDSRDR